MSGDHYAGVNIDGNLNAAMALQEMKEAIKEVLQIAFDTHASQDTVKVALSLLGKGLAGAPTTIQHCQFTGIGPPPASTLGTEPIHREKFEDATMDVSPAARSVMDTDWRLFPDAET